MKFLQFLHTNEESREQALNTSLWSEETSQTYCAESLIKECGSATILLYLSEGKMRISQMLKFGRFLIFSSSLYFLLTRSHYVS